MGGRRRERALLVGAVHQVAEALHRDDRQVERGAVLAAEPEAAHIALHEPGAGSNCGPRGRQLLARQCQHVRRRVQPDDAVARLGERGEHPPGPAGQLQHATTLGAGQLQVERQVRLERKRVVE